MLKRIPTKIDCADLYTRRGAALLAEAINAYWLAHGYFTVHAEPYEETAIGPGYWGVRSNLVNGLPPTRLQEVRKHLAEVNQRRRELLG